NENGQVHHRGPDPRLVFELLTNGEALPRQPFGGRAILLVARKPGRPRKSLRARNGCPGSGSSKRAVETRAPFGSIASRRPKPPERSSQPELFRGVGRSFEPGQSRAEIVQISGESVQPRG